MSESNMVDVNTLTAFAAKNRASSTQGLSPRETTGVAESAINNAVNIDFTSDINDYARNNSLSNNLNEWTDEQLGGLSVGARDFAGKNLMGASETPWFKDSGVLGAGAGLASALTSMAALPGQMKLANTQTDALKQNIAFAKEDQGRRRDNVNSFNSFQRSAFA
jgi:hypothetical protein